MSLRRRLHRDGGQFQSWNCPVPTREPHRPYVAAGWRNLDTVLVVGKKSIVHEQRGIGNSAGDVYPIAGEPKNVAIFNMESTTGIILDTVHPAARGRDDAVYAQIAQCDDIGRSGVDVNAIRARR